MKKCIIYNKAYCKERRGKVMKKNFSTIMAIIFIVSFAIYARSGEGLVLFISEGNLWTINSEGSDEEKICDISEYKELLMSPERNKLAGIKENDLFIMNWDGTCAVNVSRSSEIETINNFSPDGTKVVCAAKAKPEDPKGVLGIIYTNGTKYVKIKEFMISPKQNISWSPERDKITLIAQNKLYIVPASGEWLKNPGGDKVKGLSPYNPSWSPDGERIAFRANKSGTGDVWIINIESGGMRALFNSKVNKKGETLTAPQWSQEGDLLVFEAPDKKTKENNIYMVNLNGSAKILGKGYKPFWSEDGRYVLAMSEEGKMRMLNTYVESYGTGQPCISLDSLKIAYNNPVKKEIWLVDLEQNETRFLTGGGASVLGWINK